MYDYAIEYTSNNLIIIQNIEHIIHLKTVCMCICVYIHVYNVLDLKGSHYYNA